MKWKIDYIKDHGIVNVKTSGKMELNDKIKLSEETLAVGRKKNVNAFFVDHKETTFGLSVLEVDNLPAMFKNIGFGSEDKMAILFNIESQNSDKFQFLENVFFLDSLQVRVFTNPEEATAWLKTKNS
jgi:hypothetical protein